jgi:hypothetical protein
MNLKSIQNSKTTMDNTAEQGQFSSDHITLAEKMNEEVIIFSQPNKQIHQKSEHPFQNDASNIDMEESFLEDEHERDGDKTRTDDQAQSTETSMDEEAIEKNIFGNQEVISILDKLKVMHSKGQLRRDATNGSSITYC